MLNLPETLTLPLKMDAHGAIRVSDTRITLDTIIISYQQGDSPEVIHESFNVVPLNDVYAVIAYYLAHKDAVNVYLRERDAEAERIRKKWEASNTPEHRSRMEELRRLSEEKQDKQETPEWTLEGFLNEVSRTASKIEHSLYLIDRLAQHDPKIARQLDHIRGYMASIQASVDLGNAYLASLDDPA